MKAVHSYPNPEFRLFRHNEDTQRCNLAYGIWRVICQIIFITVWKIRAFNRHYEPAHGSVLYVCNHQSFLDPMIVGLPLKRSMNFMARHTLFKFKPLAKMIASVNTFPIRRGQVDIAGMKEAMRRLKAKGQLIVFAEGTRTTDGKIGPFLPGMAALAQRSADWIVPVVIDGPFDIWPKTQKLPSLGEIVVQYGRPIPRKQAKAMKSDELVETIRNRMIDIQTEVRARGGKPALKYDD